MGIYLLNSTNYVNTTKKDKALKGANCVVTVVNFQVDECSYGYKAA